MSQAKTILVTSALPYANGPIHIGHLLEYIQTDIFVRYQKLRGQTCYYFCADDAHGTPIMISARNANISCEELIKKYSEEHQRDFRTFSVAFDNYTSTHSPENQELVYHIYDELKKKNNINSRVIEQFYCERDTMFLPDRFIRGQCPRCQAEDQYGDVCESCGATYHASEIKNPACSICGQKPVIKRSNHFFFRLNDYKKELISWIEEGHVQVEVKNKLQEWLQGELRDWDISRDGPYFGFPIPDEDNKYFYVWLDAPIGYMASTIDYCRKNNLDFDKLWKGDTNIYHFIGKDIMYFHCLFWPAMLMGSGYTLPKEICIHGFLTVDGIKMSKSRGTFIKAEVFAKHIEPEFLRYYYASKLTRSIDDIDLSLEDFVFKINADIIGNFVNVFSRATKLISKLNNTLADVIDSNDPILRKFQNAHESIADMYASRNFSGAIRKIMKLFSDLNKYFNDASPWIVIKEDPERARQILSTTLAAGAWGGVFLKPVIPGMVKKIEDMFDIGVFIWKDIEGDPCLLKKLSHHTIKDYVRLADRIELKQIYGMIEESKE